MKPVLKFGKTEIITIADRYEYPLSESDLMALKPVILERGYLLKPELEKIAYWKAPRSSGHVAKNSEDYVREITSFSFASSTERARIEILTCLDGVQWPTASVILHLFHQDKYPILDFRALWSSSLAVPNQYHFDYWWSYVGFCRSISEETHVDMRTLDRALWQYSKENQNED